MVGAVDSFAARSLSLRPARLCRDLPVRSAHLNRPRRLGSIAPTSNIAEKGTGLTPSYEGQIKEVVGKNSSERENLPHLASGTAKSTARAMNKMTERTVVDRKQNGVS